MTNQKQTPDIVLLGFDGCPNIVPARAALVEALRLSGLPEDAYTEYDTTTDTCPEALKCWPSPTILVNGVDVEGGTPGSPVACRIYQGGTGAPSVALITAALRMVGAKV